MIVKAPLSELLIPTRQLLSRHRTRKSIRRTVSVVGHHLAVIFLCAARVARELTSIPPWSNL
jgi:hypothetical protein